MVKFSKSKIQDLLILLVLSFFTLGQLPGVFMQAALSIPFRVHSVDVLSILLLSLLINKTNARVLIRKLGPILVFMVFSSLLSLSIGYFEPSGLMYLVRLGVYVSLFYVFPKSRYFTPLLSVGLVVAFYGWVQYLFLPDLTPLKYFGWDDHFYRMVSTFLDPAFLGILFVLFSILALYLYLLRSQKRFLVFASIFIVSLAFTYSRASYIALIIGMLVLFGSRHKLLTAKLVTLFWVVIILLPKNFGGEGVNLSRTNSLYQKIDNYSQSSLLILKSPVFGLGFNNVCKAKELSGFVSKGNACSGLDNSLLFALATSGIVGFTLMLKIIFESLKELRHNKARPLVVSAAFAVIFHSFFTNTLFYPWVAIYFILIVNSLGDSTESN